MEASFGSDVSEVSGSKVVPVDQELVGKVVEPRAKSVWELSDPSVARVEIELLEATADKSLISVESEV